VTIPKPKSIRRTRRSLLTRRVLLFLGGLALIEPVLRFIGFHIPRKPERIEVAQQLAPGKFTVTPHFILFAAETTAWAVSRKCTHLGCTLNYSENEDMLICPCHQSHFSPKGLVLKGPAEKPLAIYDVERRESAPFFIVTL